MRRPICAPQAERTHLLPAYQAALAEHQVLVAREQQLLEEVEAQRVDIEADTSACDACLVNSVRAADGGGDAGCELSTRFSIGGDYLLRTTLDLISGGMLSANDEYMSLFITLEFSVAG